MNKRIVVIGSNSFSGSNFVDHILDEDFEVVGISRSEEPNAVFLPYLNNTNLRNFQFKQLDINHNIKEVLSEINDFKPVYVFNFVAQGMVAESWLNPDHWFTTNIMANLRLHEGLRKFPFLKKYIHISTPEVYGNCEGIIKESVHYYPSTPYAVSRAATDMSLMTFHKAYDFPVIFTRAANVFGPGQQLYRIIPKTILMFTFGNKLSLHGGGTSVRSFIHIKDVAHGTLLAAQKSKPGEIFHFSTNQNISIRNLVELIAHKMNISFEDHVEIAGERLGKDSAYKLDNNKAKELLGWSCDVDLEEGIDQTISWIRNNINVIREQPFNYIHKP